MRSIENKILCNADSAMSLSIVIKLFIMLAFGFGYYRVTIAIIVYFLIKCIISNKYRTIYSLVYASLIFITLDLDIKNGPFFMIFKFERFYHPIILFILIDYTTSSLVSAVIEYLSGGKLFSYCSNCKYENVKLTDVCSNCGHKATDVERPIISSCSKELSNIPMDSCFNYKLEKRQIDNLSLDHDECIIASIKVNYIKGIYIDDVKKLCSYISITNKNIIFIHVMTIHRGWRYRNKISLKSVNAIYSDKKQIGPSNFNVINIKTNDHNYKFYISLTDRPKQEYEICVSQLNNIIQLKI